MDRRHQTLSTCRTLEPTHSKQATSKLGFSNKLNMYNKQTFAIFKVLFSNSIAINNTYK